MAKGIFTTKAESGYDDDRTSRYHFPQKYLDRVRQTVGDLAVYYEPGRVGTKRGAGRSAYIATVRVESVSEDERLPNHFYARVSNYLDFDRAVPFRESGELFESGLESSGVTGLSGEFRNAVRIVPVGEFEAILAAGFTDSLRPAAEDSAPPRSILGLSEEETPYHVSRPIIEQVTLRAFRDAAFARHVKSAYNATCAFTGLSMRNGGGRTEVEAAHIKPIGDGHNGPDSVRNGLALSKTLHWMFDRGLLSIDSDFRILKAKGLVPEPIERLIHPSGYLTVPNEHRAQPHASFLEYHRNVIFKDARD